MTQTALETDNSTHDGQKDPDGGRPHNCVLVQVLSDRGKDARVKVSESPLVSL